MAAHPPSPPSSRRTRARWIRGAALSVVALAFACLYVWGGRTSSSVRPVSHAPSAAQQQQLDPSYEQAAGGSAQVHLRVNGDSAPDDGGEGGEVDASDDPMAAFAATADAGSDADGAEAADDGGSADASSSDDGSDDGDLSAFTAAAALAAADEEGGADEESFLASAAAAAAAGDEEKEKEEGSGKKADKKGKAGGGKKAARKEAAPKEEQQAEKEEPTAAEVDDELPAVDLAGKQNRQATLRMLLRANASPFRKCSGIKDIQFALSDQQALKVLSNSTERWGEVQWAEVTDVPCRKDDGSPGCCSRRFSFRYGSTDYLVFQQIYRDHYLKALYGMYPEGKEPRYVLDAGGNAGFSTSLFKLLWPKATVVTLEPDSSNFEALQRNTQGFEDVHLVNGGLWGRTANITLSHGAAMGAEWGKVFREAEPGEEGIPAYGVNDIAKMHGIPKWDYIKIDIEGAEGMVFAPGADMSWVGQAPVVSLEVHDFFAASFGLKAVSGRVDKAFRDHAPSFEIMADNEHIWMVDPDIVGALKQGFAGSAYPRTAALLAGQQATAAEAEAEKDGQQEEESGGKAAAERRRGRRLL